MRENDLARAPGGHAEDLTASAEALKPGLAAVIAEDLQALEAGGPPTSRAASSTRTIFPTMCSSATGGSRRTIDFYFAAVDALAYDIGVALNAWCFEADGSFNVTAARAFVDGYERRRALTAAERDALPLLARGAAMRFFLTRLNDWGATPAGALVRPKDPLEYERKLAVHRAAAASGLALFGDA